MHTHPHDERWQRARSSPLPTVPATGRSTRQAVQATSAVKLAASAAFLLRHVLCFTAGVLVTIAVWPKQQQHLALDSCPAPPRLALPEADLRQRLAELEAQLAERSRGSTDKLPPACKIAAAAGPGAEAAAAALAAAEKQLEACGRERAASQKAAAAQSAAAASCEAAKGAALKQLAKEETSASEALRACREAAEAQAARLTAVLQTSEGEERAAQAARAALASCEATEGACRGRLEGLGQGSERCWEALEAERAHAWLLKVRLAAGAAVASVFLTAAATAYRQWKQRQVTDLRLQLVKLGSAVREAQGARPVTRAGAAQGGMHSKFA